MSKLISCCYRKCSASRCPFAPCFLRREEKKRNGEIVVSNCGREYRIVPQSSLLLRRFQNAFRRGLDISRNRLGALMEKASFKIGGSPPRISRSLPGLGLFAFF